MAFQIQALPLVGLYQNIDFIVTVYFKLDGIDAPKMINDRRIFHPNLDPFSLEFAIKELVDYVPSLNIGDMLRRLKYTIIEPNVDIIPNNAICRKAACLYKADRDNFRNNIIQFCPRVLESLVLKSIDSHKQKIKSKYLNINDILPMSRLNPTRNDSEDPLQMLNRKFNKLYISEI